MMSKLATRVAGPLGALASVGAEMHPPPGPAATLVATVDTENRMSQERHVGESGRERP